ncbi:MAG: hypothetical protein ABJC79_16055 [Acidimicrobiia bacterium]
MLASIHPLGERARGQRFLVTVTAYTVGSVAAAAAFGAILGALGLLGFGTDARVVRAGVLAGAALVAVGIDATGRRLPSWHRQVNEDWLADYRGWVYGMAFGAQLGVGVITIVTTAAVYLTWVGALVAAGSVAGAVVGGAFGLARALPVLTSATLRTPAGIGSRVRSMGDWDGRFRFVTVGAEAVAAGVAVLVVLAR